MWYINTVDYYSAIRKYEILPFVTTYMNLREYFAKQNKSVRKDEILSFPTMWINLENIMQAK